MGKTYSTHGTAEKMHTDVQSGNLKELDNLGEEDVGCRKENDVEMNLEKIIVWECGPYSSG
jgi:hypothetical protein